MTNLRSTLEGPNETSCPEKRFEEGWFFFLTVGKVRSHFLPSPLPVDGERTRKTIPSSHPERVELTEKRRSAHEEDSFFSSKALFINQPFSVRRICQKSICPFHISRRREEVVQPSATIRASFRTYYLLLQRNDDGPDDDVARGGGISSPLFRRCDVFPQLLLCGHKRLEGN